MGRRTYCYVKKTSDALYEIGTIKSYQEGEMIMNENAYKRAIPIMLTVHTCNACRRRT